MGMDESLKFWRQEFSKAMDPDKVMLETVVLNKYTLKCSNVPEYMGHNPRISLVSLTKSTPTT